MAVKKKPTKAEKAKQAQEAAAARSRDARARSNASAIDAQRRVVEAAAARGIEATANTERVEVKIPPLAGIAITVPPAAPITKQDVDDRIVQLRHRSASAEGVGLGSAVQKGDQVKLDLFGYHDGDLILTMAGTWFVVEHNPEIPDLFEQIEGLMVGEDKILEVNLSEDYPDDAVSGEPAVMVVRIHEARRPNLPELEDLFEILGVEDEAGVRAGIKEELARERGDELVTTAHEMMLDEVYMRGGTTVPDGVIDAALNALWRQQEGDALAQQSVELDEQREARERFASDPNLRDEMRRKIFERALLDKVIAEQEIPEERSMMLEKLVGMVTDSPVSANTVHEMMTGKDGWDDAMAAQLRDLRAMEWLVSQIKVSFTKADGTVLEVK
jgi:trigger factor